MTPNQKYNSSNNTNNNNNHHESEIDNIDNNDDHDIDEQQHEEAEVTITFEQHQQQRLTEQHKEKEQPMGKNDDTNKNHMNTSSLASPYLKWPEEHDDEKLNWTQYIYSIYQGWTYSYMTDLLYKGSQQDTINSIEKQLTYYDLYSLPNTMKSYHLSCQFRSYYKNHNTNQDDNNNNRSNNRNDNKNNNSHVKHLIYVLWKLVKFTFIPAGYCQLITVICQVSIPLLVRQILIILETYPNSNVSTSTYALLYVILLFVCTVLNGLGNHKQRHLAIKSGIILRSTMISILYEHILYLSYIGKYHILSGEIINILATDTQKLYEVTQDGHLIWSLPLSTILVTIALYFIMGITTFIGIFVLILFVPIVDRITRIILYIRKQRIQQTDHRIQMITTMLQGIKVTKLNSYEDQYLYRITTVRNKELQLLRYELAAWAMSLVLMVSSPVIATASTFTVYVLINNGNNTLTAAQTFSVLLLFSALRFPINFFGRFIGKAAQAYSAIQRITYFLDRDVRSDPMITFPVSEQHNIDDNNVPPLELHKATFYAGIVPTITNVQNNDDTHNNSKMVDENNAIPVFQASKFNLSVKKGEVLAVCGPVGSGKSVFINGIIEEMPSSNETIIKINGNVSYMAQNAFILNTTLRENILFGRPYDEVYYNQVIDACGLRTDIDLLGQSKDLTEIGERGITLSGGQRQRVSLARGIYAKPDLVLLDDPLSALDNGTLYLNILFIPFIRCSSV